MIGSANAEISVGMVVSPIGQDREIVLVRQGEHRSQ